MKNTFRHIFAATAVVLMATASLSAQSFKGVKVEKTAVDNHDGTYTLTLNTYATGESSTELVDTRVPLDAVLVLDVSGSMTNAMTETVYTSTSQYYSNIYNSSSYYYKDGDSYYQITATRSGSSGNRRYTLTYVKNGQTITIVNSASNNTITVYTRSTKNTSQTRLDALKVAVNGFVQTIYDDEVEWNKDKPEDEKIHHRISIVQFSGGNTGTSKTVVYLKEGLVSQKLSSIKSAVTGLSAVGGTMADEGMNLAATEFNDARDDASKVVVFFTDGTPGRTEWDKDVANRAIDSSNKMKDGGASIYSISVIPVSAKSNEDKFMNYISSNYPDATSMTSTGAGNYGGPYFMIATSADGLNDVFTTIGKESTSGTAADQIEVSKTEIRDILTDSFDLPEGASEDNIKLYEQSLTGMNGSVYEFNSELEPCPSASFTVSDDKKTIAVRGFDFTTNWCGPKTEFGSTEYVGKRLVIKITIVPNVDTEGGAVTTNSPESGIYIDGQQTPIIKYKVPATVYAPMDLIIRKSGMLPGESAFFTITRTGKSGENFSITVAATCYGEGEDAVVKVKVPVNYYDPATDTTYDYTYTVAEDNTWSWSYDPTTSITKKLYGAEGEPQNIFEFSASNRSTLLHDEAATEPNFFKVQ